MKPCSSLVRRNSFLPNIFHDTASGSSWRSSIELSRGGLASNCTDFFLSLGGTVLPSLSPASPMRASKVPALPLLLPSAFCLYTSSTGGQSLRSESTDPDRPLPPPNSVSDNI